MKRQEIQLTKSCFILVTDVFCVLIISQENSHPEIKST